MGRLQDPAESTFARVAGSWGKQGPQHPAGLASIQRLSWGQPASGLVQPVSLSRSRQGCWCDSVTASPAKPPQSTALPLGLVTGTFFLHIFCFSLFSKFSRIGGYDLQEKNQCFKFSPFF